MKELNKLKNELPQRGLLEEIGNAITHGVGALLGIVMLVLLLLKADSSIEYVSYSIYGACIILAMLASCLYHSFKRNSTVKKIFRRFDYCSIYILIGGTFAPILLLITKMPLGIILFIIQWVLISLGITFVGVFGPGRFRPLHFSLYFGIGWSGVFLPFFASFTKEFIIFILIGGLCYTLGMIPFTIKTKGAHFIWHFFVLLGVVFQFIGIYLII